jgi:hypothetical protein
VGQCKGEINGLNGKTATSAQVFAAALRDGRGLATAKSTPRIANSVLKKASCRLLKKIQRRGAGKSTSAGVLTVRLARRLSGNEAYGCFSAAY